jgi:uracil phosphoribosyltransferase
MAINVLKENGVPEQNILFLNLIAAPEGLFLSFSSHFNHCNESF